MSSPLHTPRIPASRHHVNVIASFIFGCTAISQIFPPVVSSLCNAPWQSPGRKLVRCVQCLLSMLACVITACFAACSAAACERQYLPANPLCAAIASATNRSTSLAVTVLLHSCDESDACFEKRCRVIAASDGQAIKPCHKLSGLHSISVRPFVCIVGAYSTWGGRGRLILHCAMCKRNVERRIAAING